MTDKEWNDLLAAVQDLGAALEPFRSTVPLPRWVLSLDRALVKAEMQAERNLAEAA